MNWNNTWHIPPRGGHPIQVVAAEDVGEEQLQGAEQASKS